MPFDVSKPAEVLLKDRQSLRLARCWDITRRDGTHYRFTDHDRPLVLADTFTYSPVKGISATAVRRQSALEDSNASVRGIISSDLITYDDLSFGLYKEAQVDEYVVDWLVPFVDPIHHQRYWIVETSWNGEEWEAQTSSLPFWFRMQVGSVVSRTCRAELGDSLCKVDLTLLQLQFDVSTIVTQRTVFTASVSFYADNYWRGGKLIWLSGSNAGHISEIKSSTGSSDTFELFLKTPKDIAANDEFLIVPGCDFTRATCIAKFNNINNYRGYPFIPGTDQMLRRPVR
ncbi:minor tail protein L [Caudoviricetes sp.]|nr:minor tail protein L [Caudoviricetes sp.]UOF82741.1 minor tail protein L [Caudoviricetes sp.]